MTLSAPNVIKHFPNSVFSSIVVPRTTLECESGKLCIKFVLP